MTFVNFFLLFSLRVPILVQCLYRPQMSDITHRRETPAHVVFILLLLVRSVRNDCDFLSYCLDDHIFMRLISPQKQLQKKRKTKYKPTQKKHLIESLPAWYSFLMPLHISFIRIGSQLVVCEFTVCCNKCVSSYLPAMWTKEDKKKNSHLPRIHYNWVIYFERLNVAFDDMIIAHMHNIMPHFVFPPTVNHLQTCHAWRNYLPCSK